MARKTKLEQFKVWFESREIATFAEAKSFYDAIQPINTWGYDTTASVNKLLSLLGTQFVKLAGKDVGVHWKPLVKIEKTSYVSAPPAPACYVAAADGSNGVNVHIPAIPRTDHFDATESVYDRCSSWKSSILLNAINLYNELNSFPPDHSEFLFVGFECKKWMDLYCENRSEFEDDDEDNNPTAISMTIVVLDQIQNSLYK